MRCFIVRRARKFRMRVGVQSVRRGMRMCGTCWFVCLSMFMLMRVYVNMRVRVRVTMYDVAVAMCVIVNMVVRMFMLVSVGRSGLGLRSHETSWWGTERAFSCAA